VDRSANYAPAKADVYLIDRTCDYTETTTGPEGAASARDLNSSCSDVEEWETVRTKRTKVVSGKAVVHVSYTAPQDGSSHTSELQFDGRDDEFYELKAGDQMDVLVNNSDPAKVIKA
jgi:hypothetical protein